MKSRQTELTPELINYIEENFSGEDFLLKQISAECWTKHKIPQINITGYQANFLQFIIKLINPLNILEIGTLAGYSSIAMARVSSERTRILTIEKSKEYADYAIENIIKAELSHKIEVINANAKQFLHSYNPTNKLDLIFIDADKHNYMNYFTILKEHLRCGGLFIFDNAFAFGFLLDSAPERDANSTKSMLKFHNKLLNIGDFFTTIVPVGDGMLLSVKLK